MIASTVAALTVRTMSILNWVDWKDLDEKKLGNPNISEGFRTRVFKSIAKFVLSIYDVEDFVRYYDVSSLSGQCKSLYRELPRPKSKCDPLNIIAERRIELDNYSLLTEQEIAYILLRHLNVDKIPLSCRWPKRLPCPIPVTPLDSLRLKNIRPQTVGYDDISMVMTVMEKYTPLKEDIKIHLIMEHGKEHCSCISLRLLLEAFIGMDFLTLEKHFPSPGQYSFEEIARYMWLALDGLDTTRQSAVLQSVCAAMLPLKCGVFGQFTDEAIELIKYADIHRRCQGHRYVGVRHILWALSHTTISGSVERIINETGLQSLCQEPAQYPVYDIYLSSRNLASFLGVEKVGVEHLVIAILFGRSLRRKKKKVKKMKKKQVLDKDISLSSDGNVWNAVIKKKSVQTFLNEISGVKVTVESADITASRGSDIKHFDFGLYWDSLLCMIKQLEDDLRTGSCSFPPIREEHCPWLLRCRTYARNFEMSCDAFEL